jgi:lactoylglutathione lyase
VTARIEHVALWARDIDAVAAFYARWFGARVGERYENPRKGFASRFLEFGDGARLEVMARSDVGARGAGEQLGFAHVAITVGDEAAVDALAERLRAAGIDLVDGPRRTGDGYYECVVRDPEGNRVEVTATRSGRGTCSDS